MNSKRIAIVAAAMCFAGSAGALNTAITDGGLPSAGDFSSELLPERAGVVSWRTLAQVQPVKQGDRMVTQFSADIMSLDRKEVKVQGFMIPLDMGDKQKRFLISAVPPHCQFCLPAGPDAVIEVEAKTPVNYTFDPIVIAGKFAVLKSEQTGILYRLTDAGRVEVVPIAPAKAVTPLVR